MQRLVSYHAVRDTTHLYLPWHAARAALAHAKNHARAHAGAASRRCFACYASGQVLTRQRVSRREVTVHGLKTGSDRPTLLRDHGS